MKSPKEPQIEPEIMMLAQIKRLANEVDGMGQVTFSIPETELANYLRLWTKRDKMLELIIREH